MHNDTKQGAAKGEGPWIYRPEAKQSPRARLFCFPYAGGNANAFKSWSERLPLDVELCALQLPGRGSRIQEPPIEDPQALVNALEGAVQSRLELPFAFYGHSMGAQLAFELSRRLRVRGAPQPGLLLVSGRGAPHLPRERPPLHALPREQFVEELRRLEGTPEEVLQHPELMALLEPSLRADFKIVESWQYQEESPLDIPIRAFGGRQDRSVPEPKIRAWAEHTAADFSYGMFDGGHFFIAEHEAALLEQVSSAVAALVRGHSGAGESRTPLGRVL